MTERHYVSPGLSHIGYLPHYVYEIWAGDACLYVGMTADIKRRRREHELSSDWHQGVTRVEVTEVRDRPAAEAVEREKITALRPIHNKHRPCVYDHAGRLVPQAAVR